jgi:hypothetical protein
MKNSAFNKDMCFFPCCFLRRINSIKWSFFCPRAIARSKRHGPAGETINCGCESLPWMDGWEVATPGPREYSTEELFRKGAFSDARGLPAPGWAAGSPLPAG